MTSQRVHCTAQMLTGPHRPEGERISYGGGNKPACDQSHNRLFPRLGTLRPMLSEKQFRERARSELREIRNQVLSLARDRDVYWKVEHDVIECNPELHGIRNAFLDMVRAAYADAMAARVLRLLDPEDVDISLRRILTQLEDYPHLLHDKVSEREFADDRAELDSAANNLRQVLNPHFAHHERTLSALASTHRELDQAIDAVISTLKTYYWIIAEAHLDFEVNYPEDPLAIFQFAWAKPELAS
jgi:hypothetical protein